MNLFIDTTNWRLVLMLLRDDDLIEKVVINNTKKVSDIAVDEISKLLNKNNLSLNDIANFYLINGPGSYTGVRVGLTIVKTLKAINRKINVYVLNSLFFQAGNNKAISVVDARSEKWFLAVYDNLKPLVSPKLIDKSELEVLKEQYADFKVFKDYEDIDWLNNFLALKNSFILVKEIKELNPLYIKKFI